MQKVYRHVFGWFFILLGVVGLFLPFLQGIIFLLIGAIILAPEVPFFRRLIAKIEKRHPEIFAQARRLLHRISDRFRRKHQKPQD
ncbi:MAG: PGPGW domain-containing protein, partial [Syntrophales bacterium]|nr:PGPGW domain-containing protein [Syntrophales bacterium]